MSAFLRALSGSKLVGPIVTFDLVRSARRPRFVVVRTLYALLIALALGWLFVTASAREGWQVPSHHMTRFAGSFLYAFLIVQFGVVVMLTPAYTAGAIAEEKERGTLEFLLATDLSSCEIVLGKLLARLLNLGTLLLAGLPVLGFLQFLGGVDAGTMLVATAATAVTVFSVAGLSILSSVLCRRARDAIILTYVVVIGYSLLGCASWLGMEVLSGPNYWPGLADFPSTDKWASPATLGDLVDGFNAGNVPCAALRVWRGARAGAVFQQDLPGKLGRYAALHVGVGLACLGWSMVRLRGRALGEATTEAPKQSGLIGRLIRRPAVGRFPMIWKEVFVEGGLRLGTPGRVVVGLLFLASFLPIVFHLGVYYTRGPYYGGWERLTRHVNAAQVRGAGTVLATLMLLAVVVRAAGSVRSERERNTFDELLTTPLTSREILLGKWLGAVFSVRWGWAWLGLIWAAGLATGSVQFYGLLVIVACWLVYAAAGAGIGLWFSIGNKSTLRATLLALATMAFLCGGHWLLTELLRHHRFEWWDLRVNQQKWLGQLQLGLTPPFVMGFFAYHRHDLHYEYQTENFLDSLPAMLTGIACWVGLLPVLWVLVRRRFERLACRTAGRDAQPLPREGPVPLPVTT
jgi:ABC-type transport system involved in multi-copper enzyme maturation permease subunit